MVSASTNHDRVWMTPVMPEIDPTICRVYSIPASLLGHFDGALGLLCAEQLWTRGDDPSSASVADTTAAFAALIEQSWERGCRMVGEIIELAVDTVPAWALLCDGSTYLGTDYPELWAVISEGLKTDSTHFRTPDRYNRIGMYGPPIGVQGGENTHVLTAAEMPTHNHTDLGHAHGYLAPFGEFLALGPGEEPVVLAGAPSVTDSGSANIQNAGSGNAHNNLQQYEGTIFVIVASSND